MLTRDLTSISQLAEIDEISQNGPVVIFKHSTRCPISAMAWRRLQSGWDQDLSELPLYYLDLIRYREVSNAVASHYGLEHESPQILYIEQGNLKYQTSHNGINVKDIKELLHA